MDDDFPELAPFFPEKLTRRDRLRLARHLHDYLTQLDLYVMTKKPFRPETPADAADARDFARLVLIELARARDLLDHLEDLIRRQAGLDQPPDNPPPPDDKPGRK